MKTTIGILAIGGFVFIVGLAYFAESRNRMHTNVRSPSQVAAISLATAVEQFFVEYGRLPDVGDKVTTDGEEGVELLNILAGIEPESGEIQNLRVIRFLNIRDSEQGGAGLIHGANGSRIAGLRDAWGQPFTVLLNAGSDDVMEFGNGKRTVRLSGRRVAVFSPGEDGIHGTGDDVQTW